MRVLALLSVVLLPAVSLPHSTEPHARAARAVVANDNRTTAGTRRGDTLTARFTVQLATWAPEGEHHRQVDVAAFTEDGKAPMIPAPLLRVRTGTVLKVLV
ncbi:MAG: hypothetical protein ACYC3L_10895, partial [Gemmatimonadaceae bacterium]